MSARLQRHLLSWRTKSPVKLFEIIIGQPHIQGCPVLMHVCFITRLREDDDTLLAKEPCERNLRGAYAMPFGDWLQLGAGRPPPLIQGGIRRDRPTPPTAPR